MYSSLSQSQISGLYRGRKKHATFILDVATSGGWRRTEKNQPIYWFYVQPGRPQTDLELEWLNRCAQMTVENAERSTFYFLAGLIFCSAR